MPLRHIPELLLRDDGRAGNAARGVSSDIQINAVCGLIVHVDIAVIIVYRGNRLTLIIPQVFFCGDPSGAEAACKEAAGMAAAEARMTYAAAGAHCAQKRNKHSARRADKTG